MLANNNNNNNNNNSAERVIGGTAAEADQLEFSRKKKKRRRWCGMRKRIVALLVLLLCTVVALIWYFVWPRVPQLTFLEVDAPAYDYVNSNGTQQDYFNASWVLNMTADNTANWIPTHIRDMAVTVVYRDTSEPFGHGNSGSLQLFPRTLQNVEIPISIRYTANTEDPTYVALSNACGPRSSTSGFIVPTNTFNINFLVQISIDGIAWSNSRNISVPPGFSCPLPHD